MKLKRGFLGLLVVLCLLCVPTLSFAAACNTSSGTITQVKLPVNTPAVQGPIWVELVSILTPSSGTSCTFNSLLDGYTYITQNGWGTASAAAFVPGVAFVANSPGPGGVVTVFYGTNTAANMTIVAYGPARM